MASPPQPSSRQPIVGWGRADWGSGRGMTDWSEQGAVPVEDAAVEDPPTVDEVLERQREEYPEQAETSTQQPDGETTDESPADE